MKDAFSTGSHAQYPPQPSTAYDHHIPAMIARELLLRKTPLRQGGWLYLLCVCCCLALSAFYELIEWWAALATGEAAQAFLGTQGDVWDTQWDMFLALIGANTALLLLSRMHDRQLSK